MTAIACNNFSHYLVLSRAFLMTKRYKVYLLLLDVDVIIISSSRDNGDERMKIKRLNGELIYENDSCESMCELIKSALADGITNFKFADFKGADFSFADFRCANFENAKFRGANFNGADFMGANFESTNFRGADFMGANFESTNFRGADFRYANFNGADFNNAKFSFTYFRDAKFRYTDFRETDFRCANFRGADFRYAKFSFTYFRYADFRYADFRYTDFRYAKFMGADFRYANFRSVAGDGILIKSMQIKWHVVSAGNILAIGSKQHTKDEWLEFTDDEINVMNRNALEFWHEWKPKLITMGFL